MAKKFLREPAQVIVYFSREVKEALDKRCWEKKVSISDFVRGLVASRLKREGFL